MHAILPTRLIRSLQATTVFPGLIAVMGILSGSTQAGSQTAAAVYKACYVGDNSGTVYRVDDPAHGYPAPGAFPASPRIVTGCATKKDSSFTWNQVGPAGPKGDSGVAGPAGPPGPEGPAGTIGPNINLPGTLYMGGTSNVGPLTVRGTGAFAGSITGPALDIAGDGYFNYVNSRGDATITRKLVVGGEEINFGNSRVDGTLTVKGEAYLGWKRAEAAVTLSPGETGTAQANCETNRILSGGYSASTDAIRVTQSKPTDGNGAWFVRAVNESATATLTLTAYAICSNIGT